MLLVLVFALGYLAITLEHTLKINKAAPALLSGVLCWTLYIVGEPDKAAVAHQLDGHKKGLAQGISPRASPFVGYTIKPLRIPTKP